MPGNESVHDIILASKSPRRKSLLEQAGLRFSVVPGNFDEGEVAFSDPETYVKTLAEAKAGNISKKYPESWIIGADTIVFIDGKALQKPESKDRAREMLISLSGKWHQVFTGFCVRSFLKNFFFSETVVTGVKFKELSDDQIEWYINTSEPFDKAGGYAIQGLGTILVESVNGSYTNVVGLPVCEVMGCLIRENIIDIKHLGLN